MDSPTPGFDAITGNPPFLGGKKVSGALGDDYLVWLAAWDGRGVKGSTDLAARFVLRADGLLRSGGQLGYVTTNTLIEGDTLAVGLLQLEKRGWTLRRGISSHSWPSSSASLSIIEIWASKGPVTAEAVLDERPCPTCRSICSPTCERQAVLSGSRRTTVLPSRARTCSVSGSRWNRLKLKRSLPTIATTKTCSSRTLSART